MEYKSYGMHWGTPKAYMDSKKIPIPASEAIPAPKQERSMQEEQLDLIESKIASAKAGQEVHNKLEEEATEKRSISQSIIDTWASKRRFGTTATATSTLASTLVQTRSIEDDEETKTLNYINRNSNYIRKIMDNALLNAYQILKKESWKDGTKPQNKQLKAVQDCSKQLEDTYENELQYHIIAVRKNNVYCDITRRCVNDILLYRRKGLITLLKTLYPSIGKDLPKKVLPRKMSEPTNLGDFYHPEFGRYGSDFRYATIGFTFGRLLMGDVKLDVDLISHDRVSQYTISKLEASIDQSLFDLKYKNVYGNFPNRLNKKSTSW